MKFEENKVVSAFNMHDVQLKDLGWFGNTRKELKMKVETEKPLQLIARDFTLAHIFQSEEGGRSIFFYPAPYEYLQAQWVKENDLKVGDKVKVVRLWEVGERGFRETVGDIKVGHIRTVEGFSNDYIRVRGGTLIARYPYFAIEKVKDEYRPFKDAEEFKDYREEWWEIDNIRQKAIFYGNRGVWFDGDFFEYETFFNDFRHADTGNPAGIKL